ncbi:MAG: tetratricopeptide repeat protein [Alphaproteobacteria bacterium]
MADQSPAPPPKSVLGDTLRQAIKLHEEGKVTDAIPLYRSVLEANPDTAQLWCLLGVALKQSGDLSSAISHLEKAVALDPTRPDLAAELGITYSYAGS